MVGVDQRLVGFGELCGLKDSNRPTPEQLGSAEASVGTSLQSGAASTGKLLPGWKMDGRHLDG